MLGGYKPFRSQFYDKSLEAQVITIVIFLGGQVGSGWRRFRGT